MHKREPISADHVSSSFGEDKSSWKRYTDFCWNGSTLLLWRNRRSKEFELLAYVGSHYSVSNQIQKWLSQWKIIHILCKQGNNARNGNPARQVSHKYWHPHCILNTTTFYRKTWFWLVFTPTYLSICTVQHICPDIPQLAVVPITWADFIGSQLWSPPLANQKGCIRVRVQKADFSY